LNCSAFIDTEAGQQVGRMKSFNRRTVKPLWPDARFYIAHSGLKCFICLYPGRRSPASPQSLALGLRMFALRAKMHIAARHTQPDAQSAI
jgi:hypothetical protein